MSKLGKMVKGMVKAKKESVMGKLGDAPYEDPMEPWSAKYNQPVKEEALTEESILYRYIRSKGYSPEHMDFAHRSAFARSRAFKSYKVLHQKTLEKPQGGLNDIIVQREEVELTEAGVGKLMNFIKAKGLDPTSMDGNQKKNYSGSSEYRVFKVLHPEDPKKHLLQDKKKKLKETSGMGARGEDWTDATDEPFVKVKAKAKKLKEEADEIDTVTMDIPLLIRILEFAREDAKTDMDLHKVVENLIKMRGDGTLSMQSYAKIVAIKEHLESLDEISKKTAMSYLTKAGKELDKGSKTPQKRDKRIDGYWNASKRLSGEKPTSEAVEDLSELSKETLQKYKTAAHKSISAAAVKRHAGEMGTKEYRKNQDNRSKGINRADADKRLGTYADKRPKLLDISAYGSHIQKQYHEEVEELSELSKETLKSYVDKVSTGPSRGKTQTGTLKSIKAIGGVTRAIRKQYEKPVNELKKQADNMDFDDHLTREDLRKWFSKTDPQGDWKRINSKGEVAGPCAREPGEPKPKCMSKEKRAELSKSERASAVATKRKHDPVADRSGKGGKPVNVSNYGKGKLSEEEVDEACWTGYKQVGMKKKGNRMVPDCVPKNEGVDPAHKKVLDKEKTSVPKSPKDEYDRKVVTYLKKKYAKEEVEQIDEKNKPTNPALWSRAKSMARSKFDVYPSAYANGWASKWYKSKGGGWKSANESVEEGIYGIEDSPMSATNSVKAMESKAASLIKSLHKKKIREEMYDWEKDDKGNNKKLNAKVIMKGGTTLTGKPRDTVEIEPVLKTRPNSASGGKPEV